MDVSVKIAQYESFINDSLKEDLKEIEQKLHVFYSEETDFNQLKSTVLTIKENYKEGFKTEVDVGCNMFIQAKVPDISRILVDIGCGCHLEMDPEETVRYCDIRIKILKKQIDHLQKQVVKINGHIKLVLLAIHELKNKSVKMS